MNSTNHHYSKQDIAHALKTVGLGSGDNIFIHSNIGFFGTLKDAKTKQDYYFALKNTLQEILGPTGTIVVPTYSYSFCWKNIYDKKNTLSVDCGFFSEEVRKDPESFRSDDANFSIAAIGKNAQYFTDNASSFSFGPGSFWERFLGKNGRFCNFNIDYLTFIHYIERQLGVPYRFDKPFSGIAIDNGQKREKTYYHFCTALDQPNHAPNLDRFIQKSKEKKLEKTAHLGRGQIILRNAHDIFNLITEEIAKNPNFLIKGDE